MDSLRLLSAVVDHYPDNIDDAPGHRHAVKGKWDSDGSVCEWCATWQEIRNLVASKKIETCAAGCKRENATYWRECDRCGRRKWIG